MRVLPTTGTLMINVVPRFYSSNQFYNIFMTREDTREETKIRIEIPTTVIQANMDQLPIDINDFGLTFSEGDEYALRVQDTMMATIIHRNKIFFTDQVPQNYNING